MDLFQWHWWAGAALVLMIAEIFVPGFFLLVSAWMYYVGITVEPMVSLATALTVGAGALIYHFRIRPQN